MENSRGAMEEGGQKHSGEKLNELKSTGLRGRSESGIKCPGEGPKRRVKN